VVNPSAILSLLWAFVVQEVGPDNTKAFGDSKFASTFEKFAAAYGAVNDSESFLEFVAYSNAIKSEIEAASTAAKTAKTDAETAETAETDAETTETAETDAETDAKTTETTETDAKTDAETAGPVAKTAEPIAETVTVKVMDELDDYGKWLREVKLELDKACSQKQPFMVTIMNVTAKPELSDPKLREYNEWVSKNNQCLYTRENTKPEVVENVPEPYKFIVQLTEDIMNLATNSLVYVDTGSVHLTYKNAYVLTVHNINGRRKLKCSE